MGKTQILTRCAVFTATGAAILYISAFFPTLSLTFAAIAGLFAAAAVIHDGLGAGFAVYAATAALSAVLAPDKGNVILYAVILGLYPVLKSLAERPHWAYLRWGAKLVFFNFVFAGVWILGWELVFDGLPDWPAMWLIAAVAANAVFVVYDIGLGRLISYYTYRIARKIDKKA